MMHVAQDVGLIQSLLELDQEHVFQAWATPCENVDEKKKLMNQLHHLDSNYAGGIVQYISNARKLLEESRTGANPLDGYTPEVPSGESLDFGSDAFRYYERKGVDEAGQCAFVLVAGGLGERLGYSGIKIALPVEMSSGMCFLQLYIESILALQHKAQENQPGVKLPLAIMTSGDTHEKTLDLLTSNGYFGMEPEQVVLMKQEKVACLGDVNGRLAMEDPYTIQTKPHGHGDVHMLLHSTGLAKKWQQDGFKWICFFQDTNGQVFRALPAAVGVSAEHDYDVNSLAVPRKAKEAIGAITRLKGRDGSSMTINVEYNQLDPLLRATIHPEGDVNDDKTGFSPFPGNINQLVLKVESYCAELERHKGVIAEFVNPKYADESRTVFKKSTRLECMMQDFPKSLPSSARVGFTTINQVWAAYSPVKNNAADAAAKAQSGNPPHSATSGELDTYRTNCEMMRMIGVSVDSPKRPVTYNGISDLYLWPRVVWSPLFALTFDDLEEKLPGRKQIHIGEDSSMVILAPNTRISSLNLQKGAIVVKGSETIEIHDVEVNNKGWEWVPIEPSADLAEEDAIRCVVDAFYFLLSMNRLECVISCA